MGIYLLLHVILPDSLQMATAHMLKMRHIEIGLLPGPVIHKQGLHHCITSCVSNPTEKNLMCSFNYFTHVFKDFTELECKESLL